MRAFQIKTLFAVVVISLAILFFDGCRDDDTNPPPPDTKLWTLDLTWSAGGRVVADPEPRPDGKYIDDTMVKLTSIPDMGYRFGHWNEVHETGTVLVISMTDNRKITATFIEKTVEVTDDSLSVEFEVRADKEPRQQLDIARFEILSPGTYEILAVVNYSDPTLQSPPKQINEDFYITMKSSGAYIVSEVVLDNPLYVGPTEVFIGKWPLAPGIYSISVYHAMVGKSESANSVHGSMIIVKKVDQ